MAYFCNRCRLAAEKRYANCPSCGGGLAQDERSCDEFSRMGYRIIGNKSVPSSAAAPVRPSADGVHIPDDDVLSRLRKGYQDSLRQNDSLDDPFPNSNWERQDYVNRSEPGVENFFSRYTGSTPTPLRELEQQPEEPVVYIPPEPLPRTSPRIHLDFSGFGYGLMALLRAIPWRLVFTLVLLAGVVGIVMTIWNMRYVIVNSILSFLIELIPVFLIIGGIVYMIKAMFR